MKISNHRELQMSWYNKKPTKTPPKPHAAPHRNSPVTQKHMDEAKKTAPEKKQDDKNNYNR
jgi:hypothetical protein